MRKFILYTLTAAFILVCFVIPYKTVLAYEKLDFSFHKLESKKDGPTIMVFGGIQGDEPGGFNAAAILATRYKITKGNLWVIPNLNFISIINSNRGVYGDLNRKFAYVSTDDPEYETIKKIKMLILNQKIDLVLNLHDGSGFYSPTYIDESRNPDRWGQSIVIDQEAISNPKFGTLYDTAKKIINNINKKVDTPDAKYSIYNTRTWDGNEEMSKTLTYFAICNLKPAFGIETSKTFSADRRVYYHLMMIEEFMNTLGIGYKRDFDLSLTGVMEVMNKDINICLNSRVFLDMSNARESIKYIPIKKDQKVKFDAQNPLLALIDYGEKYQVFYGNKSISDIYPEYFEYDEGKINSISMKIDGKNKKIPLGKTISVKNTFSVAPIKNYRVNIIGFSGKKSGDEAGMPIRQGNLIKRFSIDKLGLIYRVEIYKRGKFSGMALVKFVG